MEAVVERGELAHRVVELEEQDDESAEEPDVHAAVLNLIAADEQEQRDGHIADGVHQRRTDGLNAHAAEIGAKKTGSRFLEAQNLPQFRVEGLDDAIAGNRFMQDVLNLGQLVLPGAGAGADFPADFACGGNHDRNEQKQRPTEMAAQADHEHHPHQKGKELLQEFADHRADRGLHFIHIVDERGKDSARGVLVKEAGGAAQSGFVKTVTQIRDHAEAGIVDQVGAQIVAEAFDDGGGYQSKGHHRPGIVHEVGNQNAQVEVPLRFGQAESDGAVGSLGVEDIIEDGLEQEGAKVVEQADHGQQQHAGQDVQHVGKSVAQEAQEILHAGLTASRPHDSGRSHEDWVKISIPVLYPADAG